MSFAALSQAERNSLARGLFEEAGYGPAKPLTVELRYNTSDLNKRVAVAIQSMWRDALGVETTLVNEEFQVLIANVQARAITEVFRASWLGDYDDAHSFLSVMRSDGSDLDRRRLYLEEAERVLLSDHAVIPLYFGISKHLVSPEVQGWEDNVLDYHYSRHLSFSATD